MEFLRRERDGSDRSGRSVGSGSSVRSFGSGSSDGSGYGVAEEEEEEEEEEDEEGDDDDGVVEVEDSEKEKSDDKKDDDDDKEKRKTTGPSTSKKSEPKTPASSSAAASVSTPGSVKKSPSLSHFPLSSAVAPQLTSIALPPQSPLARKGRNNSERVAMLEKVVKFYEELTGVTVQPGKEDNQFSCTAVNSSEHRAIEFQMLFGDTTVEYTPAKIDVPKDFTLSEEVTEAIEFDKSQSPVFLSKLIDELYAVLVPEE